MKTVAQLKADIRAAIWPSGEAENLVTAHDNQFQEAFAEIAKWVDCEKVNHVNVIKFCATNYKSGMTVVAAPPGKVIRVLTIANDDYDDPVYYRPTCWNEPEAWAANLYDHPNPLVTDARPLPVGFQFADAINDSALGRARTGIWALHNGNIYIAPWIQSQEQLLIEWDGAKLLWGDADAVNPEIPYRTAVKYFLQFAHERDFGQPERARLFKDETKFTGYFDTALADLIYECAERRKRAKAMPTFGIERSRLCAQVLDDAIIADADGVTIADLGNISTPGDTLDTIADLAKSWGPDGIIASGLIATGGTVDYDLTVGNSFRQWIAPYIGNKGPGGNTNKFWPVPSLADWTKDSLGTLQSFFPIPGNGRYYTQLIGDVHLFVIDGASDPDGLLVGGTQGVWLQNQLALSTAPWKVVKMELSPYGSVHNNVALQWPFASWGADLVISSESKNYERLDISGMPFVNNGLGGQASIEEVVTPADGLVESYAAGFGAGKIMATAVQLIYQFYAMDGTLIDTLTLTK